MTLGQQRYRTAEFAADYISLENSSGRTAVQFTHSQHWLCYWSNS